MFLKLKFNYLGGFEIRFIQGRIEGSLVGEGVRSFWGPLVNLGPSKWLFPDNSCAACKLLGKFKINREHGGQGG